MNPLNMFYIVLGQKEVKMKKLAWKYSIYSFILAKLMHFKAFFMLKKEVTSSKTSKNY